MFSGLYTMPRHAPYLATLAKGIRAATADDPLALAQYMVLVPNRRSVRVLRELFLDQVVDETGNGASVLPRLLTFGDLATEEGALSLDAILGGEPLLPPVSSHERLVNLARFVQQRGPDLNAAQALAMSRDLCNLFNELSLYQTDATKFETLVDGGMAEHWQHTLRFVTVITQLWPEYLKQIGRSDPALYRAAVLQRLAKAWAADPAGHPVIMAGIARAEPLLMDLAEAVLKNQQGAVVLPGFDTSLPDDIWANLDVVHPDALLRDVVTSLGPTRAAVKPWPQSPETTLQQQVRAEWVNLAMLPSTYTRNWQQLAAKTITADCLQGVTQITADDEAQEATLVALAIRQALEVPRQTVSLLTADRTLARRVAALLLRWGVVADDSSGLPFTVSRLAIFLQTVAAAARADATAADLLALLKHPLANAMDVDTDALEVTAFRGRYPAPGFAGLLQHLHTHKQEKLAKQLDAALGDFAKLMQKPDVEAVVLLRAHMQAAEAVASAEKLWHGAEGEVGSNAFGTLLETMPQGTRLSGADYVPWLMQLLATLSVRVPYGQHPRVTIHGLIEARLQQSDVMIVAGLNEGVWPALPAANPWLNRQMRRDLGLPSPDEVIAQQAHDFVSAMAAPTVILTRAARRDGAPTVPARWWLRLQAVLGSDELRKTLANTAKHWHEWAIQLDAAEMPQPIAAPAPCPPIDARPRNLSVTAIETWMRNPYGLYAKEVLELDKLDELAETPGVAERGSFMHAALADFAQRIGARQLAPADWNVLLECGQKALAEYDHLPGIKAFWWPWFKDVALWWWEAEVAARPLRLPRAIEAKGQHTWRNWAGSDFTLRARADRIDADANVTTVLDYKTGQPPSKRDVDTGIAPQLGLEAVLVKHGAFKDVAANGALQAEYWHLAGTAAACKVVGMPVDVDAAEAGLQALVTAFSDANVAYHATPIAARAPRYNDYNHLARTAEWSTGDEGEAA